MYCEDCGNKMGFKNYEDIPFSEYQCGHCGWNMDDFKGNLIPIIPPEVILIPVGEYNDVDLPDIDIDVNYVVWMEVENPEYGETF